MTVTAPATQTSPRIGPLQFRIKQRADGTWQWRLLDQRGQVIANCARPFRDKGECLEAIIEVRKCAGAIVLES